MYAQVCVHGKRHICVDCELDVAQDSLSAKMRTLVIQHDWVEVMEALTRAFQLESAYREDIRYDILSQKLIRVMREMEQGK